MTKKWINSRPKDWHDIKSNQDSVNESWNTLVQWDRKILCPQKGCKTYLLKTPASNDRKLWLKTRKLLVKLLGKDTLFGSKDKKNSGNNKSEIFS